ncbi:MAG: abortive infection family protein [Candidatus Limnocylindrales bacterium]
METRDILISYATGEGGDDMRYRELREALLSNPAVAGRLPALVRRYRNLGEFWQFIKYEYKHYYERANYLREQFASVLDFLEFESDRPGDADITDALAVLSSPHVHEAWAKALERRDRDPEGAITAARTLLESVCKHILDEANEPYDDGADLPSLYNLTASHLNLSPSQHEEKVFKQILGSAQAVVNGLGSVRNRLSDSHGKGKAAARPAARHAALAVNLSGSIAAFLVETWEARKP